MEKTELHGNGLICCPCYVVDVLVLCSGAKYPKIHFFLRTANRLCVSWILSACVLVGNGPVWFQPIQR